MEKAFCPGLPVKKYAMKGYLYPAISMAITATIVVVINEYTTIAVKPAYGYIFIIAAMFVVLWLAKNFRTKDQEKP